MTPVLTLDPQLTHPPLLTGRSRSAAHHLTFYLPGAFTGAVHGLMERLRASIQGLAGALLGCPGSLHGEVARARGTFRSTRSRGSSDVGRGGAQSPFSDPADLNNHLTVSKAAVLPAHRRSGPHCRRSRRRSHRRRAPLLRSDATWSVSRRWPMHLFCCVLASAARVCGSVDALWVHA
jgi:hypothetical protein